MIWCFNTRTPVATVLSHYSDVIMSRVASQITSISIVYSIACSGTGLRKTSKLCVTGLSEGNSPVTGEFPSQRASNAENVFIWWCHHVCIHVSFVYGLTFQLLILYFVITVPANFMAHGTEQCQDKSRWNDHHIDTFLEQKTWFKMAHIMVNLIALQSRLLAFWAWHGPIKKPFTYMQTP